jgi:hypothetical protein
VGYKGFKILLYPDTGAERNLNYVLYQSRADLSMCLRVASASCAHVPNCQIRTTWLTSAVGGPFPCSVSATMSSIIPLFPGGIPYDIILTPPIHSHSASHTHTLRCCTSPQTHIPTLTLLCSRLILTYSQTRTHKSSLHVRTERLHSESRLGSVGLVIHRCHSPRILNKLN